MSGVENGRRGAWQILIVDDDEAIRNLLQFYLTGKGYEVETVATGVRALERFGERPFDLVLIDYQMPGMNGLEVASALRRQAPGVTLALMTGAPQALSLVDWASVGIAKIFAKPFDICQLSEWIRSQSESDA